MELKEKIELKDKGQEAQLPSIKQAVIALNWSDPVDLDAMAMVEKKDGTTHGIFSNLLDGDMGDLNRFPYISLSEDAGSDGNDDGAECEEILKMSQLDDSIAKIYLVAMNYTDAKANNAEASFSNYNGKIQIKNETGECFEVPLNATEKGTVAHVATIDNTGVVGPKLVNTNEVMSLRDAVDKIPGMKALVN